MTIEQRMDRLERQVRWYRMLALTVVLTAVAAVSMGQTSDYNQTSDYYLSDYNQTSDYGVITCRRLRVINEKGTVVVDLKPGPLLGGEMSLKDKSGYSTISTSGSTIESWLPSGTRGIIMGCTGQNLELC